MLKKEEMKKKWYKKPPLSQQYKSCQVSVTALMSKGKRKMV